MKITQHAAKRMQQRHLPPLIIDLLQRYGQIRNQAGATVFFFDEKGCKHAEIELRATLARLDKLRDAYLVEANDSKQVVTLGYRFKRVKEK